MQRYILHDLDLQVAENLFQQSEDTIIISAKQSYARCNGCFGCWLKNPGSCTLHDGMEFIGVKLLTSDEIIIISESLYGGFSVGIKRLWDRCIPGVLPFFKKANNELHHVGRYKKHPKFSIYFYNTDDMTLQEKELAQKLVAANALNFMSNEYSVNFLGKSDELKEVNI